MITILEALKSIVWGVPTLVLLLVSGIYFTRKCAFYRLNALKITVRDTLFSLKRGSGRGISSFKAVATALGGTVGVGSIVGVGYGIAVGGAGSIFWMWVCSFFGMGLKYAEVAIALNRRSEIDGKPIGGAQVRLKDMGYKKTSAVFCFLCVLCSFGTGNLTQVGSMSDFFASAGLTKIMCGMICFAVIAAAVFGGRERIACINAVIIPSASAVYLFACLVLLILNYKNILPSFALIFREAFGISAISGGFSGALLAHTLREGFARSMFSNEAGMGSSPLAHATVENASADVQAKWGIFEIFFDTFVVSTVTALCLLSSGFDSPSQMFFSSFGKIGGLVFGLLTAVFAFASVISWCYYAECCISFMFIKSADLATKIYRILFALVSFFGVFISGNTLWAVSDILNALMMFPNLFLLFKCRNEIERID